MTKLLNLEKCILYVDDGNGNIAINPGETMDVDGRKAWNEHLFVTGGMLEIVEDKKPQEKQSNKKPEK